MSNLDKLAYNHLYLPDRIPATEDESLDLVEANFVDRLLNAIRIIQDVHAYSPSPSLDAWRAVCRSLISSRSISHSGKINKEIPVRELRSMLPTDSLTLHSSAECRPVQPSPHRVMLVEKGAVCLQLLAI